MLFACTKEDSIHIPLHTSSYSWLMENKIHYYANSSGGTLNTLSITETQTQESEGISMNLPEGTTGERYLQTIKIDTLFEYSTTLIASMNNGVRRDHAFIYGNTMELAGEAEPDYFMLAKYTDTISINGMSYIDVYSHINASGTHGIIVNVNNGLAAFIFETDTFNLVN